MSEDDELEDGDPGDEAEDENGHRIGRRLLVIPPARIRTFAADNGLYYYQSEDLVAWLREIELRSDPGFVANTVCAIADAMEAWETL